MIYNRNRQELPQSMRLIHGVGGWEKLNRRGAMRNNNMRGCKVRNATATATANAKCECDAFLYPSPILLLYSSSSVYPFQLGTFRMSQLGTFRLSQLGVPRVASASLSSWADYPSVKLTSLEPDYSRRCTNCLGCARAERPQKITEKSYGGVCIPEDAQRTT